MNWLQKLKSIIRIYWRKVKYKTSWQGGTIGVEIPPNLCNDTIMNKTNLFSSQNLTDLQDFMFDTMLPADDCVDWFCDRHDVNATDEVIDFVVDAHFAFHGEW